MQMPRECPEPSGDVCDPVPPPGAGPGHHNGHHLPPTSPNARHNSLDERLVKHHHKPRVSDESTLEVV